MGHLIHAYRQDIIPVAIAVILICCAVPSIPEWFRRRRTKRQQPRQDEIVRVAEREPND